MKKSITSALSLAAYVVIALGSASTATFVSTSDAYANSKCGGLNQKVCKKWEQLRGCDKGLHRTSPIGGTCTRDNKLIPKPIRINPPRIVSFYEPRETDCGGLNQRVCRKTEQLRGCDPGLHRTSPVKGTCTKDNKLVPGFIENGGLKAKAQRFANSSAKFQSTLVDIAKCVGRNRDAFKSAVDRRDQRSASQFAFQCVDQSKLATLRSAMSTEDGNVVFRTLSVGVGAGAMYGVGGAGETGIVLALDALTPPRFYSAGGMKIGVGASGGADVIVGVSKDNLSPGKSNGYGVGAAGKYLGGGGVGVSFDNVNPFGKHPFNGLSVSGGVGLGFEIGVVSPTWSKVF